MEKFSLQSLGGQARGKQQREIALAAYYLSPNYCLHCEILIEVPDNIKVNQVRSKKFCSKKCFWQSRIGKVNGYLKPPSKPKLCRRCNDEIKPLITTKKFCDSCRYASYKSLDRVTKGELFASSCNWQSARSSLRRHAYRTFRRTKICLSCYVCGYTNHVEIAHRKG